jgi:HK97 family phage prohead protease
MKIEVREDSVLITGYVNAVERLSKPITEERHGKIRTFLERIKSGVFRKALKRNKVLVLLNHDYERVLASTENGNAHLEEDNIGLRAEITITDKEVVQKAREGKLTGWSFGFIANDDEITTEGNNEIRTVTDMELLEVSILDDTKSPAYYGTSIEAREGGARVVEIRAENITEETVEEVVEEVVEEKEGTVDIEALAVMVADIVVAKVVEAITSKEETEPEEAETASEETEEAEPVAEETEEPAEEENRSIDYSSFEDRIAKLKK